MFLTAVKGLMQMLFGRDLSLNLCLILPSHSLSAVLARSRMHRILGARAIVHMCRQKAVAHTGLLYTCSGRSSGFILSLYIVFWHDRHRIFDADAECVDNGLSLWALCECVCAQRRLQID